MVTHLRQAHSNCHRSAQMAGFQTHREYVVLNVPSLIYILPGS